MTLLIPIFSSSVVCSAEFISFSFVFHSESDVIWLEQLASNKKKCRECTRSSMKVQFWKKKKTTHSRGVRSILMVRLIAAASATACWTRMLHAENKKSHQSGILPTYILLNAPWIQCMRMRTLGVCDMGFCSQFDGRCRCHSFFSITFFFSFSCYSGISSGSVHYCLFLSLRPLPMILLSAGWLAVARRALPNHTKPIGHNAEKRHWKIEKWIECDLSVLAKYMVISRQWARAYHPFLRPIIPVFH